MTDVFKLIEANGLTLHGDIEHFAALVAAAEREACAKGEWVGLTDEEYQEVLVEHDGGGLILFYHLIEARLREKNST
jgi:ABC-type transporter Mla MlaB component